MYFFELLHPAWTGLTYSLCKHYLRCEFKRIFKNYNIIDYATGSIRSVHVEVGVCKLLRDNTAMISGRYIAWNKLPGSKVVDHAVYRMRQRLVNHAQFVHQI